MLLQATTTGFHQSASNGSLEQTSSVQVLPAAEYMRVNDLLVHGEGPHDHVPEPCQTFESAGYPADLLEEVGLLSCDGPAGFPAVRAAHQSVPHGWCTS